MKPNGSAKTVLKGLMITVLLAALSGMPPVVAQEPKLLEPGITILTPTGGVNFVSYTGKMLKAIKQKWYATIPQVARHGKKGRTVVEFQILRTGKAKNFVISSSSGTPELDNAAIKAVRHSGPLDPLPEAFKGPYIKIRMVFLYNLPIEYKEPATNSNSAPYDCWGGEKP